MKKFEKSYRDYRHSQQLEFLTSLNRKNGPLQGFLTFFDPWTPESQKKKFPNPFSANWYGPMVCSILYFGLVVHTGNILSFLVRRKK